MTLVFQTIFTAFSRNGSSDGLGEDIETNIQCLTQNEWIKLTHLDAPISKIKKVIFTYKLEKNNISYNLEIKKYYYLDESRAKLIIFNQ